MPGVALALWAHNVATGIADFDIVMKLPSSPSATRAHHFHGQQFVGKLYPRPGHRHVSQQPRGNHDSMIFELLTNPA